MLPSNKFAANEVICKKEIGLDKRIKIKKYEAPAHCRLRACLLHGPRCISALKDKVKLSKKARCKCWAYRLLALLVRVRSCCQGIFSSAARETLID